uniref:Uncharacterized protein n=1 Tax=Anguilla anguilla TaxID=7936 RepID=A0A0E9WQB7_ANGAN
MEMLNCHKILIFSVFYIWKSICKNGKRICSSCLRLL